MLSHVFEIAIIWFASSIVTAVVFGKFCKVGAQ
jgi:hypothetical protein